MYTMCSMCEYYYNLLHAWAISYKTIHVLQTHNYTINTACTMHIMMNKRADLTSTKTGKTTRACQQTKAKTTYVMSKYMHTLSQDVSWLEIQ